jgi:hypothetical protein
VFNEIANAYTESYSPSYSSKGDDNRFDAVRYVHSVIGIVVVLLRPTPYQLQSASDLDQWMEYMRELFYT